MRELTHVDLFSGIGGFALACRWNGIKTVQFVEIDKFCQKVLKKNFPEVAIHDDIKTFANTECERQYSSKPTSRNIKHIIGESITKSERWQKENKELFLLTGGFPCQPFSCAGKRKGTNDSRHLWPEMLRVIKTLKPKWIIGENVAGIINIKSMEQQDSESGMESETFNDGSDGQPSTVLIGILNDLEQAGYSVQIFVIPACSVGAPHRRDRVWIVANSNRSGSRTSSTRTNGNRTEKIKEQQFSQSEYSRQDSHATEDVGNSSGERLGRGCENSSGIESGLCRKGFKQIKSDSHAPDSKKQNDGRYIREDELLYGRRGEWSEPWLEVATRLCRVDDGVPRGMDRVNRLKSLGNAIVPQVADQIIKAILKVEYEPDRTRL